MRSESQPKFGNGFDKQCPKSIIDVDIAKKLVNQYGEEAIYQNPAENPYVIELLHRIGIEDIEHLLHSSPIFNRKF